MIHLEVSNWDTKKINWVRTQWRKMRPTIWCDNTSAYSGYTEAVRDTHCKISNYSWPCPWRWGWLRGRRTRAARARGSWRVHSPLASEQHCHRTMEITQGEPGRAGGATNKPLFVVLWLITDGAKCGHRVQPPFVRFSASSWQGSREFDDPVLRRYT